MVIVHRIVHKQGSMLGIVAVDLLSLRKVGMFLKGLLPNKGLTNLGADHSDGQSAGVA